MPRYNKGCIGRRAKRFGKKSKNVDQQSAIGMIRDAVTATVLPDNSTCQPGIFDENVARQLQWTEAWAAFYIGPAEHHQDDVASESESDGTSTDSDNCSADEFYVLVDKMYQYNPNDNLDDIVTGILHHRRYQQYSCLKNALFEEYDQLGDFSIIRTREDVITLSQFYEGSDLALKLTVTISPSLMASISVHRQKIGYDHDFWIGLPKFFSTLTDVKKLLSKLSSWHVCLGNYEDKFSHLIPIGVGLSQTAAASISAYREGDFGVNINGIAFSSTIRSARCALLAFGKTRCEHCCRYRSTLRKTLSRNSLSPKPTQPDPNKLSHKTHKHMSKMELVDKFRTVKTHNQALKSELAQLKRKVFQTIGNKGLKLNMACDEDLRHMLKEYSPEVQRSYPDGNSLQRLFWEQQVKYSNLTDKRSMRWHPMVIKWCLYLRSKSRKAYDAARQTGFIKLPSKRTLFDYSHSMPSILGFHPEYATHLMQEAKAFGMLESDVKSYVGILQDEVKVSEGLVYDRSSGELVGYVDLDKTGNELLRLEDSLKDTQPQLARTMLVIMIRGIVADLRYPYAAFATRTIEASYLYSILWETVLTLENIGLMPLFITCDGATPNRKFFEFHHVPQLGNTYWTWNPYSFPKRKLYFISDVPHLLKTTRNCFANSGSHKMSRQLWKDNYNISWMQIVRLYEQFVESSLYCKTYKLTRDHIDLTSFSTMKVNLAAEVFSTTVANALEEHYGDEVKETVSFIRHMDKFFDCLNTRSLREGVISRNSNKKEYRDVNDPRLDYLVNDFLNFFKSWEESVMRRPGDLTLAERRRMMLSHQTLKGLHISVKSIVECVRYLLTNGADYILTHRFNQDPLEEQFGQYRQKGGANDNPSVYNIKHMITEMKVIGSAALQPIRGNISQKRGAAVARVTVDDTPMPRKKQKRLN